MVGIMEITRTNSLRFLVLQTVMNHVYRAKAKHLDKLQLCVTARHCAAQTAFTTLAFLHTE